MGTQYSYNPSCHRKYLIFSATVMSVCEKYIKYVLKSSNASFETSDLSSIYLTMTFVQQSFSEWNHVNKRSDWQLEKQTPQTTCDNNNNNCSRCTYSNNNIISHISFACIISLNIQNVEFCSFNAFISYDVANEIVPPKLHC